MTDLQISRTRKELLIMDLTIEQIRAELAANQERLDRERKAAELESRKFVWTRAVGIAAVLTVFTHLPAILKFLGYA